MNVNFDFTCNFDISKAIDICKILISFFLWKVYTQDNTPPMPLYDAHLGGFFFLN